MFELDESDKAYACDQEIRDALLKAAGFDWSKVSPSVFGSMFESVMDPSQRRESGSHYTTTENVLKVLEPLFLDDLWGEYYGIIGSKLSKAVIIKKLGMLQRKLSNLKFMDPACGSGSFLITAYEEIRKLEYAILGKMYPSGVVEKSQNRSIVNVNQFYGIELNPFAAKITETAMWMVDHLENRKLGKLFDGEYDRLPLEEHPNIRIGDALEIDWNDVLPSADCNYIIGNPPFGGGSTSGNNPEQTKRITGVGKLDYVSNWFVKSAQYCNDECRIGLVATNSIVQGEQVSMLWPTILDKHRMSIIFGYSPFNWETDAKGGAKVHVVILGLSKTHSTRNFLYTGVGKRTECSYLSPYLRGFSKKVPLVAPSTKPLNGLGRMKLGSKPVDNGLYIFTDEEKTQFLKEEPKAEHLLKPYITGKSFLHGGDRWILDLHDINNNELQKLKKVYERVNAVQKYRAGKTTVVSSKLADTPTKWQINVIPQDSFLLLPEVSSENRRYIPVGFRIPPAIPSNKVVIVENASTGVFGILSSKMHMAWVKLVAGRLKSDFSYSSGVVYNTFPLPDNDLNAIQKYAEKVLEVREKHSDQSLAELYGGFMQPDLLDAHKKLDRAVDRLYRKEPFNSDRERWEFLLDLYEKSVNKQQKLVIEEKKPKKVRKSKPSKPKASKSTKNVNKSKQRKHKTAKDVDSIDSYVNN